MSTYVRTVPRVAGHRRWRRDQTILLWSWSCYPGSRRRNLYHFPRAAIGTEDDDLRTRPPATWPTEVAENCSRCNCRTLHWFLSLPCARRRRQQQQQQQQRRRQWMATTADRSSALREMQAGVSAAKSTVAWRASWTLWSPPADSTTPTHAFWPETNNIIRVCFCSYIYCLCQEFSVKTNWMRTYLKLEFLKSKVWVGAGRWWRSP